MRLNIKGIVLLLIMPEGKDYWIFVWFYKTDCKSFRYQSGGPLLDLQNNVVGVISSRLSDEAVGSKVENIGFAIKNLNVIEYLKKNSILFEVASPSDKITRTIEDLKKSIFMIQYTAEKIY